MATFNKLQWEDFVAQYPCRFKVTDNGDGTVTITDEPGEVIQEGTPVNAENLNRIEQGIADLFEEDAKNMKSANNLAEITDKEAARRNLGLGDMATKDAGDYLEKSKALADLPNKELARENLGLGNIATKNTYEFLTKAGNLEGLQDKARARSNLGLGSLATENKDDYLSKSGNLSGISNKNYARINLGLKNGATTTITFSTKAPTSSDLNEGDLWFIID